LRLSPDEIAAFDAFGVPVNMTIAGTWAVMGVLLPLLIIFRRSMFVEACVEFADEQARGILGRRGSRFTPLTGTLFIFILACNWSALAPGFMPPTASLSTAAALAFAVMASTVFWGIKERGAAAYFGRFTKPIFILFPFNMVSEAAKGFSLAIRLYGNIMSGTFLAGMVFALAPVLFPALLSLYGLVAGTIQPYIFMVLASVYIGTALGDKQQKRRNKWIIT